MDSTVTFAFCCGESLDPRDFYVGSMPTFIELWKFDFDIRHEVALYGVAAKV